MKKSKKQLRTERKLQRQAKRGGVDVNVSLLAAYNSYGLPAFVERGFYVDWEFVCQDCGVEQVWTARQQKWWFEVAKGYVYSGPNRCRECRRQERVRRDEARRVHFEGLRKKQQAGK